MKKRLLSVAALLLVIPFLSGCSQLLYGIINASANEKALSRGTVADNVYTNEYADITFTAPDGWQYASDSEIAEIMGLGADTLNEAGLEFSQETLEGQNVYDMLAQNMQSGSNVIVMFENLAMSVGGTKYTEDKYIDTVKQMLEDAQAYNYVFSDVYDEQVSDNTYKVLKAELPDVGCVQYYYCRKIGKYMHSIIVSVFGEDDISSIMAQFS